MKIVDRKTFLELPSGTIYTKYTPMYFGGLCVKWESMNNDFVCQGLDDAIKHGSSEDFEKQCEKAEKGEDVEMDFNFAGRDGLFDPDQLFAVWSKEDIKKLITLLESVL